MEHITLSQKQIQVIAKKIATNTKDTKFSNSIVIGEILTLLTKQRPCYSEFEYLGKGESSLVLKAKTTDSGYVALKIVEFDQSNQKAIEAVQREYGIVKSLQTSEYIIKLNSSFFLAEEEEKQEDESVDVSGDVEEEKFVGLGSVNTVNRYFVQETELCKGNLADYLGLLRKNQIFLEEKVKIIMVVQMLDAINYLHQRNTAHRDIKPQNFLFQEKEGQIILKLCDFGFASPFDLKNSKSYFTGKGILGYSAPEVEKGQRRKESDLYSLGIIIVEIDNSPKFNYSEVTTVEVGNLQLGQEIFPNHNLKTSSLLFQIASALLKPNFQDRTSASIILLDLLKQQHDILKDIPIYSIIRGNQLQRLPFSIPQSKDKKLQQLQELRSISVSLPSSDITTKKKIDALLNFCANQNILLPLTSTQAEGALKALFKKGDYDNFEILGAGSRGLIVGGMNLRHQRQSALKICHCENKAEIFRQIDILKKCQMPRIVKFYGHQFIKDENNTEYVVFEMEKCESSLSQYIDELCKNNTPYSFELKMNLSIQMIDSVNYLHELDILHRDIKLDNFLISEDETGKITVKLTDFDQATQLQENYDWKLKNENHDEELLPPYNCVIFLDKQSGTPSYYAPERFNALYPTTKKADAYSLGLCLLVLDNYLSFSENDLMSKHFTLINPYTEPFIEQEQIIIDRESQIYKIANKLLAYLPQNRISLSKILADSNNLEVTYSRQIDYPFNQKNIQKICYFKMVSTKEKVAFGQIIDFISIMSSLSSLSLNLNEKSIGESGANYVSTGLIKLANLQSLNLNLSINSIGDLGANYVMTALIKLTNLSSLSLDFSQNSIGEQGAKQISTKLSTLINLSSLHLDLSSNSIGESGVKHVLTAQLTLTNISSLSLNLSQNSIGESGAKHVQTTLSTLTNLSSLSLDLSWNQIGELGADYVSTALSTLPNLSSLSLNLKWNSIRGSGAKLVSTALSTLINLSSLNLDLSINLIGDLGAKYVQTALVKLTNLSSLSLNLSENLIEEQGAKDVSNVLLTLTNLSSLCLDLRRNSIREQGADYVSTALFSLINLSSLSSNLSETSIGQSGANYVSKALETLTNLSSLSLDLRWNQIGESGANNVSKALIKLTNLSSLSLNLSENQIGESGVNHILVALVKLTNLSSLSLNLRENLIEESGLNNILSALQNLNLKNKSISMS